MRQTGFRHLSSSDRVEIEVYLQEGTSQYEIARLIGCDRSTISREIKKRGAILSGYSAAYAQKDYVWEKARSGARRKIETHRIGSFVIDRLKAGWSPEAIAERLKKEINEGKRPPDEYINHESIYQFVYESAYGKREKLRMYLRQAKRRRTKQMARKTKREMIPNRIWIDERPHEVNRRESIGHWETDTIMYGRKRGINSLVERKTRYVMLTKIADKQPNTTAQVIVSRLSDQYCRSITTDNGIEMRNHETITNALQTPVYFCHPYHSWEKGSNEHANGIVRRYLPKHTDISLVSQCDIDNIAWEINNRPRKILGFATAQEMLELEYSKEQLSVTVAFQS